jgi:hypothetical protein
MNGPPLVIYGSLHRWSVERFRATLQGYFLPSSLVATGGYLLAALWVTEVTRYYLMSLPLAIAAIILGRMINRHLNAPVRPLRPCRPHRRWYDALDPIVVKVS